MPPRFDRVQRSESRDVVLGIDYGTSTTKVMCRPFGERQGTVVAATENGDALWPSLVAIHDGRLHFGHDAAECPDPIPWLKMVLAQGPKNETALGIEESYGLHPHMLAAFFLAWVIADARRAVKAAFGDVRLTYNLAAPLDNLSDPSIEERYALTLHRAEQLARDAIQGWSLESAQALWDRISGRLQVVPPESERATFVLSEVHAATCEVVRQQRLPDGHYAVLDIGAGTTDISVFLFRSGVQQHTVNGTIAYFASGVLGQACNAVDHRIIGALSDAGLVDTEDIWSRLLSAKQNSRDGAIALGGVTLGLEQVRALARPIGHNIHRRYLEVVAEAFEKEARRGNWQELRLLFIGGGGRFQPFRDRVQSDFPLDCIRSVMPEELHLGERPNLLIQDRIVELPVPEYLFFVASGLSYHVSQIPEEIRPHDVSPLPAEVHASRQATRVFCSCNGLNPDCFICGGTGRGSGLDDAPLSARPKPTIDISEHIHCRFCGNVVARSSFANHLRAQHPESGLIWREPKRPRPSQPTGEALPPTTLPKLLTGWRAAYQHRDGILLPGQLQNLLRCYHEAEGIADRDRANLEQVVRLCRGGQELCAPYSVLPFNLHLLALLRLGHLKAFLAVSTGSSDQIAIVHELVQLRYILWSKDKLPSAESHAPRLSELSFRVDDSELASELADPGQVLSSCCDWLAELIRASALRRRGVSIPGRLVTLIEDAAPSTPDVKDRIHRLYDGTPPPG